VADPELEELAAAVLGEKYSCDQCDAAFPSKASLGQHKRNAHPRAGRAPKELRIAPAAADLVVDEVVGKAVANLQVLGGFMAMVLPHTGLAIAGVPHPDSVPNPDTGRARNPDAPPIVQSRAIMAGHVLEQWAKRDERVLKAMARFNALFETSEVVEVAAGVGAALAVDLGIVDAHMSVEVGPFTGDAAIRPVQAVIGDVIAYVDAAREQQAQAEAQRKERAAPDGVAPDGAEIVAGGVEGT
jgi:hypothetical protein